MTETLAVWWGDAVVGALAMDRHGAMRFTYEETWLADPSASALSVSLPKRRESFRPSECRPFFEGLLPEGAQRDAAALGASPGNVFRLLEGVGGEVAGAIALHPAGKAPAKPAAAKPNDALSDDEIQDIVGKLELRPLLVGEKGLRLSLAGAQSKLPVVLVGGRIALPKPGQPTTHVLKPPIARFAATTENEAFAMRLAARIGLAAAHVEILAVVPEQACLLVERYDRRSGTDGNRATASSGRLLSGARNFLRTQIRVRRRTGLPAMLRTRQARLLQTSRRGAQAARRGHLSGIDRERRRPWKELQPSA